MIYYKYFTTRFLDPINDYDQLKAEFPLCSFIKGQHKGAAGIYIVNDLHNREYSEKIILENNDIFWGPADPQAAIKQLNDHLTNREERISVKLGNGVELKLFPASAIPRKVLFRSRKTEDQTEDTYNKGDRYGQMAYDIYMLSQSNQEVPLDDPRILELIQVGLEYSYNLTIDVFDSLEIVSQGDIERLLSSCLGFDYDDLLKKTESSKVQ